MTENKRMDRLASRLIILLACAFMIAGCKSSRKSEGVLSSRKMELFLYDYHLAQAAAADLPRSDRYKSEYYFNYVYDKHDITKEEIDLSLKWYARHPDKLHSIYEKLDKRIAKDKKTVAVRLEKSEKKSFSVSSGDSIELWYLERNRIMTDSYLLNPIQFKVPVDSTFHPSDTLLWRLGLTFLGETPDSVRPYAYLALSMKYGDSISTVDAIISESSDGCLTAVSDDSLSLDMVSGIISYQSRFGADSTMLLLDDISLLRIHTSHPSPELGTDDGGSGGDVE